MCRVIEELRPTWVIGENVAGIVKMALDKVLSDLESKGYATIPLIIPACGVDAQHRRERVFIIANSNSEYVEGRSSEKVQGWDRIQGVFYPRGFEDIRRMSEIYKPKLCRTFNGIPSQGT